MQPCRGVLPLCELRLHGGLWFTGWHCGTCQIVFTVFSICDCSYRNLGLHEVRLKAAQASTPPLLLSLQHVHGHSSAFRQCSTEIAASFRINIMAFDSQASSHMQAMGPNSHADVSSQELIMRACFSECLEELLSAHCGPFTWPASTACKVCQDDVAVRLMVVSL